MPISFDGKKGEFSSCVANQMSKTNKRTGKKFTKNEASKVCGSIQARQEKQASILYSEQKIKFKEEAEEFYSEGFVATDHQDREGDILSGNALQKIVDSINNQFLPQAGVASNRHDWLKENDPNLPLAGMAISADIRDTEDGHKGVYVQTHHHKYHPEFEEIKYNVEKGYYPGYSIEFETVSDREIPTGRIIDDLDLVGYGFANKRLIANPHAQIVDYGYKELLTFKAHSPKKIVKGETKMEEKKLEIKEDVPEEKKEEPKVEEKKEEETKEIETKEVETKEQKEHIVSKKDFEVIQKMRREKESADIDSLVAEKIKKELDKQKLTTSPLINTENGKEEFKELDDYKKSLAESKEYKPVKDPAEKQYRFKRTISRQYKEAATLYNSLAAKGIDPWKNFQGKSIQEIEDGVQFDTFESNIEMKELANIEMKTGEGGQVDTNIVTGWTYTSYYLSPVELNDIFQPVLVNQLNDQTMTFGRLQKENWAGRSSIEFRARTGRNDTAAGYSEGENYVYATSSGFTGSIGRDKFRQPYCYYHVKVAVTGQAQRFAQAPGGMGDRWADEIKWSGLDLAVVLNQAILGSGDGTSEAASLGFQGLILGTTGDLYGKALASTATLRSHKVTQSGVRVTLTLLRDMIRAVRIGSGSGASQVHSTARLGDLVFFMNHLQLDFIKGLLQDMQRLVPTSARAGFEGEVEFDGVPCVADKDITNTIIYLIDTAHTKIAMNLPPTLEPLPVTADAQAAHIKTYWNLYSDAPGNNYYAHTLATS